MSSPTTSSEQMDLLHGRDGRAVAEPGACGRPAPDSPERCGQCPLTLSMDREQDVSVRVCDVGGREVRHL